MLRRDALTAGSAAAVLALAGCAGSTPAAGYAQAKAYLDAAVDATLAGAQQYLAGPPKPSEATAATITQVMDRLAAAKAAVDGSSMELADWKSGAIDVLLLIQQLAPTVTPFLGPAAPFLSLAVAVVMAFIQALPPPPQAPPTPPAALARKAMELRRR